MIRVVCRVVVICSAFVGLWLSGSATGAASAVAPGRRPSHPNATCNLPAAQGSCKASFRRFRYDAAQGGCVAFTYGGCGGNANLFETLEACRSACP